jgi:hypothetical protein
MSTPYLPSNLARVGHRFGRLRLIYRTRTVNKQKWLCMCDCLSIKEIAAKNLLGGNVSSCGCLESKWSPRTIVPGQQFGDLRLLYKTPYISQKWLFMCQCLTIKEIIADNVLRGVSRACRSCANLHKMNRCTPHSLRPSYGLRRLFPHEYGIWNGMKDRCRNPNNRNWKNYGGRGITICDEWRHSFATFLEYVGPRPGPEFSIDRYPDNDGNYEPGNVRWATKGEQQRNTRRTHVITLGDKSQCALDWIRELGLTGSGFYRRVERGMSYLDAVAKPRKPYRTQGR